MAPYCEVLVLVLILEVKSILQSYKLRPKTEKNKVTVDVKKKNI